MPATPKTECACDRCVGACKNQPGWFAPGEAEAAAKLLKMPFDEFVRTMLIKDHCDNEHASDAPYVYAPRKVGVDRPTDEVRSWTAQRTPGTCVFLKNDRCSIHAAKPFECAKVFACDWKGECRTDIEGKWIVAGAPLGMRPEYHGDDCYGALDDVL